VQIGTSGLTYWDATGLYIETAGGTLRFPTDGSAAEITALLTAFALTVSGQTTLHGQVAINNTTTMAAGITTPSAPTITEDWPSLTPQTPMSGCVGLIDSPDGVYWLTSNTAGIHRIHKTTGAVTTVKSYANVTKALGLGRRGNLVYYGVQGNSGGTVNVFYEYTISNDAGTWTLSQQSNQYSDTGYGMDCVGSADSSSSNRWLNVYQERFVQHIDPTDINVEVDLDTLQASYLTNPNQIVGIVADLGTVNPRYVTVGYVSGVATMRVHTHAGTATRVSTEEWTLAPGSGNGIWYTGGFWYTISASGVVTQYSGLSTSGGTARLTQTIREPSVPAETPESTTATITRTKRKFLRVTTAVPPSAPAGLTVPVYGDNGAGSRYLQGTATTPTVAGQNAVWINVLATSGTIAPTSQIGTFSGGATTGKLTATTNGPFWIDGASNGSVGTGTFRDSVRAAVVYDPAVKHRCVLTQTTSQSFAADVDEQLAFETELVDVGGLGDLANDRIVIVQDGLYAIRTGLQGNGAWGTGFRGHINIYVGTATVAQGSIIGNGAAVNKWNQLYAVMPAIYLTTGTTVHSEALGSAAFSTDAVYHTAQSVGTFLEVIQIA
jgi:hypothetical protein